MINGIQQVGIGTPNVHDSFKWYRQNFGFDVPVFDEAAEAPLMTQYTGDTVQSRHAILAMNLNGGGGMEIWQYTSREPAAQLSFSLKRPGLLVTRIKCENAKISHSELSKSKPSNITNDPMNKSSFSVIDPYGNPFIVSESNSWYKKKPGQFGGIEGIMIGVTNMEKALTFYRDVMGIDKVLSDEERVFEDLKGLEGGTDLPVSRAGITARIQNSGEPERHIVHPRDHGCFGDDPRWESEEAWAAHAKEALLGRGPMAQSLRWNTGCYLWLSGLSKSLEDGVEKAQTMQSNGVGTTALEKLIAWRASVGR